jgi:hypothetical protein
MTNLRQIIADELAQPVDPQVVAMGAAIAAEHPGAARAVLFYGSCLRERSLEGLMLDFYLIVSDYRAAYARLWLAAANRLIPPNVFPFAHEGLSAKYAVLSEADFERECGQDARSTSVFARFAQPARLVWARDEAARERAISTVAAAPATLLELTKPMLAAGETDPLALWRTAFDLTYAAELRAERSSRPGAIVDADPRRYRQVADAAGFDRVAPAGPGAHSRAKRKWRRAQIKGKGLSVVRLAKASLTFAEGIDYLAWKINRHAGTEIKLAAWQRRWPLLGALTLLPRLFARGAIR